MRQKPRGKKELGWLDRSFVWQRGKEMQLEWLAGARSHRVLEARERDLILLPVQRDSHSQICPDNTNNQWF